MGNLIILGSANAVPDIKHDNTHMVVKEGMRVVLVDCSSGPVQNLAKSGIEINQITDLILTHFHPDHVSGAPLLLLAMWLTGRKESLAIHGLKYTIERFAAMMELFGWQNWTGLFPVDIIPLDGMENEILIDSDEMSIYSSPVHHFIPTIGIKIINNKTGKSIGYSCDTEPCDEVVNLTKGVDILLHESHGAGTGHSSAAQAGSIAECAKAGALYLIHYPCPVVNPQQLINEAKTNFTGRVELAEDQKIIDF